MGFVLVTDLKCVPYIHSHNQLSKWNTVFFLLNWLRNQRLKLTDLTEICAIISRQSAFSLIQMTLLETVLSAFFPHCCWLWILFICCINRHVPCVIELNQGLNSFQIKVVFDKNFSKKSPQKKNFLELKWKPRSRQWKK